MEKEKQSFPDCLLIRGSIKEVDNAIDFIDDVCCLLEDSGLDNLVDSIKMEDGTKTREGIIMNVTISSKNWKPGFYNDIKESLKEEEA